MDIRETVLLEIEKFSAETGLAETSIGSFAVKDSRFVDRLRSGQGVSLKTIEKLRLYLVSEKERRASKSCSPAEERAA